jgi:KaiC/GvpD/RAD55 family RecA-like ATPase
VSALGEKVLIQHLVDIDSLAVLSREGLNPEVIPTEDLREVVGFALDYFFQSGLTKAPSQAVFTTEFGDLLDDHEIELEDPEDSLEWALDDLKGSYVYKQTSAFVKNLARDIADAPTADRVEMLGTYSSNLTELVVSLESRRHALDAAEGLLEKKIEVVTVGDGMMFGIKEIDEYTRGIHPGELAVLAAPPKMGKSYITARIALKEWQAGRSCALYTLENSIDMTLDRLACLASGVSLRAWSHKLCSDEDKEVVHDAIDTLSEHKDMLILLQPPPERRTVEQMVREAQVRGADSIIIDQLSEITLPGGKQNLTYQISDVLYRLKTSIQGRTPMSCLLVHQVNREGMKNARKLGYLHLEDLADSASVERRADWVFGIYRSYDEQHASQAKFQTLASRREDPKHYQLVWNIDRGVLAVRQEISLGG